METRTHWDNVAARIDATWAFCDYLRQHPEEVKACVDNPDHAKKVFAKDRFYLEGDEQADPDHPLRFIPKETVFRVFEYDPKVKRDQLVTIVLPDPKKPLNAGDVVDATEIWRCTWPPYLQLQAEKKYVSFSVS